MPIVATHTDWLLPTIQWLFLKEIGGGFVYTNVGTTTMAKESDKSGLDGSLHPPQYCYGGRVASPETKELIPTRESLLSRLKDWKDRESWQDFFDTYWKLIYGIARKAGLSDAEAQDIVQETVISVARKIEGFKYDPAVCSFKSWMLKLTRWRIINQLKRRERDKVQQASDLSGSVETPDLRWEQIPDPAGLDLEAIWNEEWEKNLLSAALERIRRLVDPEQFQIFDLYCLEQWPARKVACTLGVSVGRVYLAKHRVGRLLKKEVAKLERGQ